MVGAPSPGHWTARKFLVPGNINWHELTWRSPSQHQDPAPPNSLQAPELDTSEQTTSNTGIQSHPSADRLPKIVLSSQIPQNIPLDTALPRSTTRAHALVPSTRKPTQATKTNLTDQGADTRSKRNYDPAACRKKTTNRVS